MLCGCDTISPSLERNENVETCDTTRVGTGLYAVEAWAECFMAVRDGFQVFEC